MKDHRGVVFRTDLADDGDLAVLIEVDQGIHHRGIVAIGVFVGHLKGTDVLQPFDADIQALVALLVEFHRLVDAPVEKECQCEDAERENEIGQKFSHIG